MLSKLHSLNLKLCSGRQHNYSMKTRQVGHANEQFMYSLMSVCYKTIFFITDENAGQLF